MKRRLALSVSLLLAATSAFAATPGTTSGQILTLPVGPRALGMGTAQGAAANDVYALYYNPAALTSIEGGSLSLMHTAYFQSIYYDNAAFAQNMRGAGVLGIGAQYLNAGTIEQVDNTGASVGNGLHPHDQALSIGYAVPFQKLDLGIGIKYFSSTIDSRASSIAGDLGSRYRFSHAAVALSVSNLGRGLKYQSDRSPLPRTVRAGTSFFTDQTTLALDVIAPQGDDLALAAGAEYRLPLSPGFSLAGRVGYNTQTHASELGGATGISVGGGINFKPLQLDYAFAPHADLGNSHYVSLGVVWGPPSPQ